MKKSRAKTAKTMRQETMVLDPNLRALLDHVAEELAKEYVKLMKDAVRKEK